MRLSSSLLLTLLAVAPASCGPAPDTAPPPRQPAAPTQALGVGDPLGFIRAVYARYAAGPNGAPAFNSPAYSPRLRAALAEARPLTIDPWLNGTDGEITAVSIEEAPPPGPGRRLIIARLRVDGRPVANRFEFIEAERRWLLDDVVSEPIGDGAGWRLSEMLAGAG